MKERKPLAQVEALSDGETVTVHMRWLNDDPLVLLQCQQALWDHPAGQLIRDALKQYSVHLTNLNAPGVDAVTGNEQSFPLPADAATRRN